MNQESSRLIRGQIWRWYDPIYGEKKQAVKPIEVGEVTMRYNRYVVVLQNTSMIDTQSVLVVPCSSSQLYDTDVKISLSHVFSKTDTYARVHKIFPVHPKTLERYICTASEETMQQIEAVLASLILPMISRVLLNQTPVDDSFRRMLEDAQMRNSNIPERFQQQTLNELVRKFVDRCVCKCSSSKVVHGNELKDAFDHYCILQGINPEEIDMPSFIDSFCYEMHYSDFFNTDKYKYNHISFKGITLKDLPNKTFEIKEPKENLEPEVKPITKKHPSVTAWDYDKKVEFLKYYESHSPSAVSEKYHIAKSTALKYKRSFQKDIENHIPKQEDEVMPGKHCKFSQSDVIPAIARFSDLICFDLTNERTYQFHLDYSNIKGSNRLKKSTFYKQLHSGIYHSLLTLFNIQDGGQQNWIIPKINNGMPYYESLQLIIDISCSFDLKTETSASKAVEKAKKKFGNTSGINKDWIPILRTYLSERLSMKPEGIDKIIDSIVPKYCAD